MGSEVSLETRLAGMEGEDEVGRAVQGVNILRLLLAEGGLRAAGRKDWAFCGEQECEVSGTDSG